MRASRRKLRVTLTAGFLLALPLHACSEDPPAAAARPTGRPELDAAAEMPDAGAPAPLQDAGGHAIYVDDTFLCGYDDSDQLAVQHDVMAMELASAATKQGFGQVYARKDGALFVRAASFAGAAQTPRALTTAADGASGVALVGGEAGFLVGYREPHGQGDALVVRDLDAMDQPAQTLTDALHSPDAATASAFALAATPTGYLAAYRTSTRADAVWLRVLDERGAPSDEGAHAVTLSASAAEHLQLSRMSSGQLLLAFSGMGDAGGEVTGQLLTSELGALGSPFLLSKHATSELRFGLAAREGSAGVLYAALDGGVRNALKLRRIEADGALEGPVLNVADAPRRAYDGAIAAFGRGYVVVYRELPSLGVDHARVRIAFVNPFGSVVYDAPLAQTSSAPAVTSVAVSGHRVLASWTQASEAAPTLGEDSAALHSLRMDCPGALVLCGGKPE